MNYVHHHRTNHFYYRNEIISHLDTNYHLLSTICQNLEEYMKKVRQLVDSEYIGIGLPCVLYRYVETLEDRV